MSIPPEAKLVTEEDGSWLYQSDLGEVRTALLVHLSPDVAGLVSQYVDQPTYYMVYTAGQLPVRYHSSLELAKDYVQYVYGNYEHTFTQSRLDHNGCDVTEGRKRSRLGLKWNHGHSDPTYKHWPSPPVKKCIQIKYRPGYRFIDVRSPYQHVTFSDMEEVVKYCRWYEMHSITSWNSAIHVMLDCCSSVFVKLVTLGMLTHLIDESGTLINE